MRVLTFWAEYIGESFPPLRTLAAISFQKAWAGNSPFALGDAILQKQGREGMQPLGMLFRRSKRMMRHSRPTPPRNPIKAWPLTGT